MTKPTSCSERLAAVAAWVKTPEAFEAIAEAVRNADARAKEREELRRVPRAVREMPMTI